MPTNLRETYKSVENRMAALRESATRDKHSLDMELRSIGQSDSMLVSLFGEKKAV